MLKNSWLSIKKNVGKSILLFVIMIVIANLIIAGLSIQSASQKSMEQIRSTLGNDVTLSVNMRQMMGKREPGQAMEEVQSKITIDMADQLKDLEYVTSHNYAISTDGNSNTLTAVEMSTTDSESSDGGGFRGPQENMESTGDFTIEANQTMENLSNFTSGNYELTEGRLLSSSDEGTSNCVIETNLAKENSLKVGDTITIYRTVNDQQVNQELKIVGLYEIINSEILNGFNRNNPVNTIYTDLSVGQTLTGSTTELSSAVFYLNDPSNIDAFITLANDKTDIDFDTYSLNSQDGLYQQNVTNLENTASFASMFLIVVVLAGSVILCLILILTIRNRFYEIGVFLSLGQSKLKIIGQQLLEVAMIAVLAFTLSLATGKMVSNVVSNMLVQGQSNTGMKMEMTEAPSDTQKTNEKPTMGGAFEAPSDSELDVSLTSDTIIQLVGIAGVICVISTMLPAAYILRLSPREILIKKEG